MIGTLIAIICGLGLYIFGISAMRKAEYYEELSRWAYSILNELDRSFLDPTDRALIKGWLDAWRKSHPRRK